MDISLLRILISLVILSLLFGAIEFAAPALPAQRRLRSGWRTDLGYWLLTPVFTRQTTRLAVVLVLLPLLWLVGRPLQREQLLVGFGPVAQWPFAVQVMAVVVSADFIGYWCHRAFHREGLWPFHAIHHSSTELDWLSAVRVHPVNDALTTVAQAVPLILLGFPPMVAAAYAPLLTLYAIGLHANVSWDFGPLRRVISSPRFHRWHHTSAQEGLDRNFAGLLPIWDQLFGTFYMPRDRQPTRFGTTTPVPTRFWAQLLWPFRQKRGQIG